MTTNPAGAHAVIVGASMAGLLAAAATARHYQRVTLLEREVLPPAGQGRRAVPQGRHVHAFLPGGLQALDQLLPGLPDAMVAAGAIRCESMREIRTVISGHEISRAAMGADNLLASRPFFEGHVRTRVLGLPNVELRDGVTVDGLLPDRGRRRVDGVRVSISGDSSTIDADLVVVATGRAGQVPAWLKAFGCATPDTDELIVDLMYASRHLSLPVGALGNDKLVLITPVPDNPRGLGLFAQEDGTWLLTAAGWGKEHRPPIDDAGHLEFIASFAPADLVEALRAATPLDQIVTHAFPSSRRRRYERLSGFPEGLLVIGDAISSFNPAYGQGMSVAALEAAALKDCLASGTTQLARRYFRAIRGPVKTAWDMAVGSDLALPVVVGPRPLSVRLSNAWVERVLAVAEYDARTAETFSNVADLLCPPSTLLAPRFIWRVLTGGGRKTPNARRHPRAQATPAGPRQTTTRHPRV
jgi:2-polyprenyl-6-methoxyphenol hydroxylase-like FAD-dependent oxidoreductase